MKCKNCGEENLSEAGFCYKCGHPLDGDATEDNSYKETSAEVTGAAAGNGAQKTSCEEDKNSAESKYAMIMYGKNKLFENIAVVSSLLAACVGFIFVFFIGCKLSASLEGISLETDESNIFYYFYGVYEDINNLLYGAKATGYMNIAAALCTILCGIVLIAVTVLFIVTLVKILERQSILQIFAISAATYLAYICGVGLFMLCTTQSRVSMENRFPISLVGKFTELNDVTIAGIIIGGIAILPAFIYTLIVGGKGKNLIKHIPYLVCGIIFILLTFVAIASISGELVETVEPLQELITVEKLGILQYFADLARLIERRENNADDDFRNSLIKMCNENLILTFVLAIIIIAFFVFIIMAVAKQVKSAVSKKSIFMYISAFISGLLLIAAGIIMINITNSYIDWCSRWSATLYSDLSGNIMRSVLLIVVGVLLCVTTTVQAILGAVCGKKSNKYGGKTLVPEAAVAQSAGGTDAADTQSAGGTDAADTQNAGGTETADTQSTEKK